MNLDKIAQELSNILRTKNLKLATAESCTGGGLSYYLTKIPGSSMWFERGFVTYSNESKIEMLNVSLQTLETFGAVSEDTAKQMAVGAITNSHADIGVSITGIAGPEGGTTIKPVGTVWIACAQRDAFLYAAEYRFKGDRENIRQQAMHQAFENLLTLLQ